jgi:hypothetical protein
MGTCPFLVKLTFIHAQEIVIDMQRNCILSSVPGLQIIEIKEKISSVSRWTVSIT